jgi:hypothetical protein
MFVRTCFPSFCTRTWLLHSGPQLTGRLLQLVSADNEAVTISWASVPEADSYSVEMRAETGASKLPCQSFPSISCFVLAHANLAVASVFATAFLRHGPLGCTRNRLVVTSSYCRQILDLRHDHAQGCNHEKEKPYQKHLVLFPGPTTHTL